MASIRMKTDSAGPAGNRTAGKVYTVTAEEGAALVQGKYAEWVESPALEPALDRTPAKPAEKPVEVAIMPEPENAALRTKPAKKKRR